MLDISTHQFFSYKAKRLHKQREKLVIKQTSQTEGCVVVYLSVLQNLPSLCSAIYKKNQLD